MPCSDRRACGLGAALALLLLAAAPLRLGAQNGAYRFLVGAVSDSTISFSVARSPWVRVGQTGIAVDPRRGDALVARFRVVRVEGGEAIALITGQTTRLTTDVVATLERPRTPWWRSRSFWGGTVLGAIAGALVVSQ